MIIYVNWSNEIIYSEKEFPDAIDGKFNSILNNDDEKNEALYDFLCYKKGYDVTDVFNLSAAEKEEVWSEFLVYLHNAIGDNMKEEFDKYEFE